MQVVVPLAARRNRRAIAVLAVAVLAVAFFFAFLGALCVKGFMANAAVGRLVRGKHLNGDRLGV